MTMYSTGEPCPMCMGAIHWQRLREIVWSVSIVELILHGRPQIALPSLIVHQLSGSLQEDVVTGEEVWPIDVIRGVARDEMAPYFAWQFDGDSSCPDGCHRDVLTLPGDVAPRCIED